MQLFVDDSDEAAWCPPPFEVLAVERGQRVGAEPFQALELSVTALLGGDDEESG